MKRAEKWEMEKWRGRRLFSDSFGINKSLKYREDGYVFVKTYGDCGGQWATLAYVSLKAPFQSFPTSIIPTTWAGCDCDFH